MRTVTFSSPHPPSNYKDIRDIFIQDTSLTMPRPSFYPFRTIIFQCGLFLNLIIKTKVARRLVGSMSLAFDAITLRY